MAEQMTCNHQVVGSTPSASSKLLIQRKGWCKPFHMKEITKQEIDLLAKNGFLTVTGQGVKDKQGNSVSYTRTKHRHYIMDEYVDIAQNLMRGLANGKKEIKN